MPVVEAARQGSAEAARAAPWEVPGEHRRPKRDRVPMGAAGVVRRLGGVRARRAVGRGSLIVERCCRGGQQRRHRSSPRRPWEGRERGEMEMGRNDLCLVCEARPVTIIWESGKHTLP